MITIEHVVFDPTAAADVGGRSHRRQPFSMADLGGAATLLLLMIGLVAPFLLFAHSPLATRLVGSGFELRATVWAALLAVFLPLLQIVSHIRRFGGSTIRGNREDYPQARGAVGRIARAHANAIESLAPFVAVILGMQALGGSNIWTVSAAGLYVAARLVHSLSYVLGLTIVRSAAFYGGVVATVVVAFQLPLM